FSARLQIQLEHGRRPLHTALRNQAVLVSGVDRITTLRDVDRPEHRKLDHQYIAASHRTVLFYGADIGMIGPELKCEKSHFARTRFPACRQARDTHPHWPQIQLS